MLDGVNIPADSIQRVADAMNRDEELEKALAKADLALPMSIRQKLRHAFTVRGLPFFEFYIRLRRFQIGEPVPSDIKTQFRRVVNRVIQIKSPVDKRVLNPVVVNQIAEARVILNVLLNRLLQGRTDDVMTWVKVNQVFVPLIISVAKDKGVYLKAIQRGRERWATFRRMSAKQEKIEQLRDDDPEAFALMSQRGEALEQIDEGIKAKIEDAGLTLKRSRIMGRPVNIGVHPVTGEERIYDRDGEVLTHDDFMEKRRAQEEYRRKLHRAPSRMEVPMRDIRLFDDSDIDSLEGEIEWSSMTDDQAKQGRLTRIFATKRKPVMIAQPDGTVRIEKVKVITAGRFKGVYLDDMVNSQGRMIEGTAFTLGPKTGRVAKVPVRRAGGGYDMVEVPGKEQRNVVRRDVGQQEPYATAADVKTTYTDADTGKTTTVKEQKLFLKIPGTKPFTEIRNALKALACNTGSKDGCIPSISYHAVKGSRAATFYFDPKDYGAIRDAAQGMSLSKGALDRLKTYFNDLARAEQATAKENLGFYSAESLGGFKVVRLDRDTDEKRKFDLLTKQKQALAWMDAKGNNGVCALDTGVGKSLTAIAMMQKLRRDGLTDADASFTTPTGKTVKTNGRFLLVTPGDLKGNFPKEIRNFISEPGDLLAMIDIISYYEFRQAVKGTVPGSLRNKAFWKQRAAMPPSRLAAGGKVWDIQLYSALFFDEAQKLTLTKKGNVTGLTKPTLAFSAANVFHPRKIFLTASPMEKEPEQAYLLHSLSNNEPLAGGSPEAEQNRTKMRRFMQRFTERVGGRIVGVKQDEALKSEMRQWVKQAVFFADKRNVEEFTLPDKRDETRTVTMDPQVEEVYRATTKGFAKMMRAMSVKMKERGDASGDAKDAEHDRRFFGQKMEPVMSLLNGLANYPDLALRDLAFMKATGTMPDKLTKEGVPAPVPPVILTVLKNIDLDADGLHAAADQAAADGNPKLRNAEQIIMEKLEAADGSRALVFADDKKLCEMAAQHMASRIPGLHVMATNEVITILSGSGEIPFVEFDVGYEEVLRMFRGDEAKASEAYSANGGTSRLPVPFSRRAMRKHPNLPAHKLYNLHYKADQWQQFVLKEVVSPNRMIRTCTLLGSTYQFGHNLQAFDQVIHLDRNTWNSESMKQRTARSWRQGQEQPVDVTTIDAVYAENEEHSDLDATLDEIRKWFQEMEGELFDAIIKEAQGAELGKEWFEMQKKSASFMRVDREVLELMTSPFVSRSR